MVNKKKNTWSTYKKRCIHWCQPMAKLCVVPFCVTPTKTDKIYFDFYHNAKEIVKIRQYQKPLVFFGFGEVLWGFFVDLWSIFIWRQMWTTSMTSNVWKFSLLTLENTWKFIARRRRRGKKVTNDNLYSYVFFVEGFGFSFLSLLQAKRNFSSFFPSIVCQDIKSRIH